MEGRFMRKLVETIELDEIAVVDAPPLRFRLEIFEQAGRFSARLLRWEVMRLRPSFSDALGEADYSILVEDDSSIVDDLTDTDQARLVKAVVRHLAERLSAVR